MPEYIQVPVPADLVTDVMQLILERSAPVELASTSGGPAVDQGDDEDDDADSRKWTLAQLEMLYASDAPSVKVFCEVLSILADISPRPMSIDEIGQRLGGVKGLTLQQKFGAVSRWIRKRMGGDMRWPIHFPDGGWAMNDHNAALWKQVTSHA